MDWFMESEPFQQLMEACKAHDYATQDQIVQLRLLQTAGRERAFWLRVRARQRSRPPLVPHLLDLAWVDLEEALRSAPSDETNRATALTYALELCVRTEQVTRLPGILAEIRQQSRQLAGLPMFWQNLALLYMRKRRWHQGARAFARGISAFASAPAFYRDMYQCRLSRLHAYRSSALIGCGRPDEASEALDLARSICTGLKPEQVDHLAAGFAEAELAFWHGEIQAARTALQQGIMLNRQSKRRQDPSQLVEAELLAARLARAEGNTEGFRHFCERGLSICSEHTLPLSAAAVRAVAGGAGRQRK